MKIRKLEKGELTCVILLGIVSAIFLLFSIKLFMKDTSISSEGFVPVLTSVVMLVMSFLMLFEMRKCPRAFEGAIPVAQKVKETVQFLFPGKIPLIILYCVIYSIILSYAGFIISTFAFLVISMMTLHKENKVKTVIISAGILVFILVVFQFAFKVILP